MPLTKKQWLNQTVMCDEWGRPPSLADVPLTYMSRDKAFKKQDSNDSLLAQGFNRMKNKFVEGAESGAKDFGYRVFGGKGSPDQGAFDNPNDLGQTSAYEVPEVYDFIDNRNYLAFSNLEEDLRNNQGFNYGTVEYNLGVNSALKNISSYYTPEINLG